MASLWSAAAAADAADDERRELEQNRGQQERLGAEITDLEQSIEQLDGLIQALDAQIVTVTLDLMRAEVASREARAAATNAQLALAAAIAAELKASGGFDEGVRTAYVRPPVDATGAYLLADDAPDAGRRMALIGAVVSARGDELEVARELRGRRKAAESDAVMSLSAAHAVREEAAVLSAELASLRAEHEQARVALETRLAEFRAEVDALAREEAALVALIRRLEAEAARAAGTAPSSLIWPARGYVSSEFGPRWGRNHNGIDIAASTGTAVRAAARGVVSHAAPMGSFGNLIIIDHGGGVVTLYAHLHSISVRQGQRVNVGELVATVGSTGRSTGPHLHFEVRRSGKAVDPRTLLR